MARGDDVAPSEYYFRTTPPVDSRARLAFINDLLAVSTVSGGGARCGSTSTRCCERVGQPRPDHRGRCGHRRPHHRLSLHEIGARVDVFERVHELRPLGVGINLLPHAVRESMHSGCSTRSCPLGRADEPRVLLSPRSGDLARAAGHHGRLRLPQLSIHRGALQDVLLSAFVERVGPEHLHLGHRLERVEADGARPPRCSAPTTQAWWSPRPGSSRRTASTASPGPSATPPRAGRAGTAPSCGEARPRPTRCWTAARWSGPATATRSSSPIPSTTSPAAAKSSTSSPNSAARSHPSGAPRIGTGPASSRTSCPSSTVGTSDGWTCQPSSDRPRAPSSSR